MEHRTYKETQTQAFHIFSYQTTIKKTTISSSHRLVAKQPPLAAPCRTFHRTNKVLCRHFAGATTGQHLPGASGFILEKTMISDHCNMIIYKNYILYIYINYMICCNIIYYNHCLFGHTSSLLYTIVLLSSPFITFPVGLPILDSQLNTINTLPFDIICTCAHFFVASWTCTQQNMVGTKFQKNPKTTPVARPFNDGSVLWHDLRDVHEVQFSSDFLPWSAAPQHGNSCSLFVSRNCTCRWGRLQFWNCEFK